MFAFTISLAESLDIKHFNWVRTQNKIVHFKAEMLIGSKTIEIVALVYLNLVLINGYLICEYRMYELFGYTCTLSAIRVNDITDGEILGVHQGERNDSDVKRCDVLRTTFETFPPICEKFTSLVQIAFTRSGLQFIQADSLNGCTHLTSLYLNSNYLTKTLPGMFQHSSLLLKLELSANKISQMHSKTFIGLGQLENLELRANRIKVLHPEIFSYLTSLKRLNLAANQVTQISPGTFARTANIEFLKLEVNQLRRLNANMFGSMLHLTEFNFAQNEVDQIDAKFFEKLPVIKTIFALANSCVDKNFFYVMNISTQINPYLNECYANWNERICKFSTAGNYVCTLSGLELTKPDERFDGIQFQHAEGRSNQDVGN